MRKAIGRVFLSVAAVMVVGAGASPASVCTFSVRLLLPAALREATLRSYGESLNDVGYDLALCEDGGILLVGQAGGTGPSHRIAPGRSRVLRLTAEGDVLWEHDYMTEVDGLLYSPLRLDDGTFVILGQTVASYVRDEDDVLLLKIDCDGEVLWSHTYGGLGQDNGKMVRQTSDGGFILVGSQADERPSYRGGVQLYQSRVLLVKTDAQGNELWSRTYGEEMLYIGWGVEETPDGGYVLAGWEAKTLDDRDAFVLKTDETGEVEWSRTWDLDPGERDGAFDLILTSDGHIVVCGIRSMNAGPRRGVLLKVDMEGNEIWLREFGDASEQVELWDVLEDSDGGYVASGAALTGEGGSTRSGLILKVDADGEELWQQVVEAPEYTAIHFASAAVLPSGGYVFVGAATPADAAYWDMLWMKAEP